MKNNNLKNFINIKIFILITLLYIFLLYILNSILDYKFINNLFIIIFFIIIFQILYTKFILYKYSKIHNLLIEKNESSIRDQDHISKMLIRRDLELTRANENLQKLDKMKSEFISTAAHQLRTPLSGIKWTLSMILNNDIKEKNEQKAFLMKAYESNDRIINLVNDMLVADRVESSTEKYNFVPTDIFVVLDSVILDLLPQINKKNILINIKSNNKNMPKIYADSLKIRSVFQNLLENSIKYSKENGKIDLDFVIRDNFIQFSIRDYGIGIPESQKKNIFSKFFRGENAKRIVADGTGLGLFIVNSVIEKHEGKIWFDSEENKGTIFYFTLPIY